MTQPMRHLIFGLVSALMIAVATPLSAYAGSLTIYNKNCTTLKGFKNVKRVTVHVYGCGAEDEYVTVHQGASKTIQLNEDATYGCTHEALGTVGGKPDVKGNEDSHVTCKKDWLGVCQCTKD